MIERWLGPPWVWLFIYGVILGFALYFASPAKADPVDNYVARSWQAVCATLDQVPSVGGVAGVIEGVMNDSGFGAYDSGKVVAEAVNLYCPRHLNLLAQFVAVYRKGQAA